jgi:hypothetical protein
LHVAGGKDERRIFVMAHVIRFVHRRVRLFASLGTALLVPPLVCWVAVVLVVMANQRAAAALLHGIEAHGGPGVEVVLLLVCPLLAVAVGFTAIRRVPRGRRGAEVWCWAIIGVGLVCAVCAVLASLRPA